MNFSYLVLTDSFYFIFTLLALFQGKASQKVEMRSSEVARKVRNLREGIVQGRGILQVIFSVAGFSKWAMKYLAFNKQKAGKS